MSDTLYIGEGATGSGQYWLGGGTLTAGNEHIGYGGWAYFQHDDGSNVVSGALTVGALGQYYLTGASASVSAQAMDVRGMFDQYSGSNTVGSTLKIGGVGQYKWRGGTLSGTALDNGGLFELSVINLAGSTPFQEVTGGGTFRVLSPFKWNAGGNLPIQQHLFEVAGGNLIIANGTIESGGTTFINNGTFQLQNSGGIGGSGRFENNGLLVTSGNGTISIPFERGGTIDVQSGELELSGDVSLDAGGGALTKYGSGILKITGNLNVAPGVNGLVSVSGGLAKLNSSASGALRVMASSGATFELNAAQSLWRIEAYGGGRVKMSPDAGSPVSAFGVTLNFFDEGVHQASGRLDIGGNWLHLDGGRGRCARWRRFGSRRG